MCADVGPNLQHYPALGKSPCVTRELNCLVDEKALILSVLQQVPSDVVPSGKQQHVIWKTTTQDQIVTVKKAVNETPALVGLKEPLD